MTVALSPVAVQQFFNSSGAPLAGGLLFTYAAGTTTKLATYTDSTGATPNTNPIVMDARGECTIWLTADVAYKFVLSPSGDTDPPTNPIWTEDNIQVGSDSGGSSPLPPTGGPSGGGGNVNGGGTTGGYTLYAHDTGTPNAMVVALVPAVTSLTQLLGALLVVVKNGADNTGPTTLNVNSLGAIGVVSPGGTALSGSQWPAGAEGIVTYNGTNFVLAAIPNSGSSGSSALPGGSGYSSSVSYFFTAETGTANALVVSIPSITALTQVIGIPITIENAVGTNTGTMTLGINSLGAIPILAQDGQAMRASQWPASAIGTVIYDGGDFRLVSLPTTTPSSFYVTNDSGTANLIQISVPGGDTVTFVVGCTFTILKNGATNTGGMLMNLTTTGLNGSATQSGIPILFNGSSGLVGINAGQWPDGTYAVGVFNGTQFIVTSIASSATASLTTNGYEIRASGVIEQWGFGTFSQGQVVTFPISFPNLCWNIQVTNNSEVAGSIPGEGDYPGAGHVTNTNFTIATKSGVSFTAYWRALGN